MDFDELEKTLLRMEADWKLAWDYLKVVKISYKLV